MNSQITEETHLVTLVGPPNSGKTTLFNLLSGKNYKTVNYPPGPPGGADFLNTLRIGAKTLDLAGPTR